MNGQLIAAAIAAFTPIVRALIVEAEHTGKGGAEKHAAVSEGAERIYRLLQSQGTIKELRDVPWEVVGPVVVPVAGGLISIVVGLLNRLFGKVWGLLSRKDQADG